MQSLPCMSYNPGKWDSLCLFYRWECGVFNEGPSQGPDPGWSGSEACALDPEDTFCPWPATTASFEDVAALVLSWPWERVLFSPAGRGRVLKHTGSVERPGPPWGVTHTATGRPGFLTALGAAAPPTRLCRAVLWSEMCQQPALPRAWLILCVSEARPRLGWEPMTNSGPSLKCCSEETSRQEVWPSRDPCICKRSLAFGGRSSRTAGIIRVLSHLTQLQGTQDLGSVLSRSPATWTKPGGSLPDPPAC